MRAVVTLLLISFFLVPAPAAQAKSKKASPAPVRMNGVEYLIRADQEGSKNALKDMEAEADERDQEEARKDDPKEDPKPVAKKVTKQPELVPEMAEEKKPPCDRSVESPESQPVVPPTIIIDAGHGGKDPGATGNFGKGKKKTTVREKDIVLQISKQLAAALKKKLGAKVSFTRPNDTFITLGDRDRIATRQKADLFLSVHANASKNPEAKGLEIYYLNKASDEASRRLAARENEGAPKQGQDLDEILSDLLQTAATEESSVLASGVSKSFRKELIDKYDIPRLEVKTALFYVLVGAKCPSLLIETGFVTNPEEGKRLKQVAYQKDLANAIAGAVAAYWTKSRERGSDL